MPLYEYRCTQCGNRFEKIQKFNAEPEVACPKCGGQLERPLTAPALQFKGAGWYVNDYAPKSASGSGDKSAGEGGSKAPSEAAPGASSEVKSPEAKPASESKPAAAPSASSTTT